MFVATYLDTEIGRLQLNLVKGRSAQPHINAGEVAAIQIPLPTFAEQERLVAAMDKARAERKTKLAESDALLTSIDDFVLDALGITPPPKDPRRVFATHGQIESDRFDPHFHLPHFVRNQEMLSQARCEVLGSVATFSKETWKPQESEQSMFRYIEISTVSPKTGKVHWNEVPTAEAPSRARMKVRADDIIVSLTRPHHGSIAHLGPEFDGCVASTGFAVIRGVGRTVRRDYLWSVLRSQFCLSQMLQRSSGGNYPAIIESELARILIPIPNEGVQEHIATEVQRRHEDSRRLRAEADSGWQEAKQWFEAQLLAADE